MKSLSIILLIFIFIGCRPFEVDKEFHVVSQDPVSGSGNLNCDSTDPFHLIHTKKETSDIQLNDIVNMRLWEFSSCKFEYYAIDDYGNQDGLYLTSFEANGAEYQKIEINTTRKEFLKVRISIN